MITNIKVDGFKSLSSFNMKLNKGLNILVGPNGAGKTNVISYFEFITHLVQRDLSEAVSLQGGAGVIFTKKGSDDFQKKIHSEIMGEAQIAKNRYFYYIIDFEIEASTSKGLVYYKNQRLRYLTSSKKLTTNKVKIDTTKWNVDIEISIDDKFKPKVHLHQIDKRKVKQLFERMPPSQMAEEIEENYSRLRERFLIAYFFRFDRTIENIFFDLSGGETFNIVPSRVKQPEDIAKQPNIKKDGTGLASTLYGLKSNVNRVFRGEFMFYPFFRSGSVFDPKTFKKVIDLTNLANPSIIDIDVQNNTFDNQLMVKITVEGEKENTILPLSAMSDGTIKWITLVTAILTTPNIFSIEEPENFLHPWMQSEIVSFMRSTSANKNRSSFILMSTHSETLLNSAKPEEVIIISMENGKTKQKRVSNSKLLKEEISKTGFGLGYYYITGALNHE